jgi:hypothetical protein
MNGQVKRYELAGLKVKGFQFRDLYPESAGHRRLLLDTDNRTCSPRLYHNNNDGRGGAAPIKQFF